MPRFSSTLREHAAYPVNEGPITEPNGVGRASVSGNPPFVSIYLLVGNGNVAKVGFESQGCGVTTAACSSLTELIENKSLEYCKSLEPEDVANALDGIPSDKMHCAKIAIAALRNAIEDCEGN